MQRWPLVPNAPQIAPSTASSRFASSMTMIGFLPPISRWTCLNDGAHASLIARPTDVEPVKETTFTRGSLRSGFPTFEPEPVTTLKTPGGSPASSSAFAKFTTESGVSVAGLMTTVFPQTSAAVDLPRRDRHREVPGRDERADADRRAHRHRELVRELGRRRLAVEAAALAAHEEGHVDRLLDVAARLLEDLAHLARHVARVLLLAVAQDLAEPVEDLAALRAGHEAPALVRRGCGVDGVLHVALVGVREAADQVGHVRGVAVLEAFGPSGRERVCRRSSCRGRVTDGAMCGVSFRSAGGAAAGRGPGAHVDAPLESRPFADGDLRGADVSFKGSGGQDLDALGRAHVARRPGRR